MATSFERSDPTKKDCRQCAMLIPIAANKCHLCDSFQDWRGNLYIGATLFSSLTALIATSVALTPLIKQATARKDSQIIAWHTTPTDDGFRLILINAGDRPGVVIDGDIEPPPGVTNPKNGINIEFGPRDRSAILIKAGESMERVFQLQGYDFYWLDRGASWQKLLCHANIRVRGYKGALSATRVDIPCSWISGAAVEIRKQIEAMQPRATEPLAIGPGDRR